MNQEEQKKTDWETWIEREPTFPESSGSIYDKLCDLAVTNYNLTLESKEEDHADRIQFFILWWCKNKFKMKVYLKKGDVAKLLKRSYAIPNYYQKIRKPSADYDINTECLKDFLES